jgi:GT2 family glycosyltransferase
MVHHMPGSMNVIKKVTVIIPHWNGMQVLRRCLDSMHRTDLTFVTILIVNNASNDGSMDMVTSRFPEVQIVHSSKNLGFAGGCNLGIRRSSTPYVALLNNDAEVTRDWLLPLIHCMENDTSVAAVQPKLLSIHNRQRFDYCGGAGGEIDLFGYPYTWGRLFDTIETDEGQYDKSRPVFWATGAATLLRRSALKRVGILDELFFAHMEEIDLNWRMQIAGYRILVEPKSVVFHETGATLKSDSYYKMVLNHRNNLMMLLKNHSAITLCWLFPLRLMLECLTLAASVIMGQPKRSAAVAAGFFNVIKYLPNIIRQRKQVQGLRSVSENILLHRMHRGSAALAYFLKGVRTASDLSGQRTRL